MTPAITRRQTTAAKWAQETAMSHAIREVDDCAQAIEKALDTMNPPIEIQVAIVQVIAKFAVGVDEWRDYNKVVCIDKQYVTLL